MKDGPAYEQILYRQPRLLDLFSPDYDIVQTAMIARSASFPDMLLREHLLPVAIEPYHACGQEDGGQHRVTAELPSGCFNKVQLLQPTPASSSPTPRALVLSYQFRLSPFLSILILYRHIYCWRLSISPQPLFATMPFSRNAPIPV